MRVDFYQLSGDRPDETGAAVAAIARKAIEAGERLLVVAGDAAARARLSRALWSVPGAFLAHGEAGGEHDARQPILLSDSIEAVNGSGMVALADGVWREGVEAAGFARAMLFFDEATIAAARGLWKALPGKGVEERHYWRREGSGWVKAG